MKTLFALLLLAASAQAGIFFNGTDYITVPDSFTDLQATNAVTFNWSGFDYTSGGNGTAAWRMQKGRTAFQWAIIDDGTTPVATPVWQIYYEGPGRGANRYSSGLQGAITTGNKAWNEHTLAVVFGGSATVNWFIDGALRASGWTQGGTGLGVAVNQPVDIGLSLGTTLCKGAMAEVAYWNTNLNSLLQVSASIGRLKRFPLQLPANLKMYLPLDEYPEGSSVTATNSFHDLSGHGNNASPVASQLCIAEKLCSYPPNE